MKTSTHSKTTGFSLIELLIVIAIIGVLSAILLPVLSNVRDNARRTQGRATFSQWQHAIELFRQEYGFWPDFRATPTDWAAEPLTAAPERNLVIRLNDTARIRQNFVEFLTGYQIDGDALSTAFAYQNHPNRKRMRFYSLTENDYIQDGSPTANLNEQNIRFVDSYYNEDIVIIMDGNQNGIIPVGTNRTLYGVRGNENPASIGPVTPYATATDVRASILIYSGGKGGIHEDTARKNIIRSW